MFERMLHSDDHSVSGPGASLDTAETASASPLGRRAFIAGTAGAIAATAVGSRAHAAVPAGASYYEPVEPIRLADTRRYDPYRTTSKSFERLNDRKIRLDILNSPYAQDVPSDAVAVVVSFAVIYDGPVRHNRGWAKVVPAGTSTLVSNVNVADGDGVIANLATVRLGSGGSATLGKIDVECKEPYDVVVDIVGVYRATSVPVRAGRLEFLPTTRRALTETYMPGRSWRTVKLSFVPTHAQAVVVNLTVTKCRTRGFLTALAQRTPQAPSVSNLNYLAGEVRAAGAIVKVGQTDGVASIELYSHGGANALVDVTGYITGPTDPFSREDGLFVPINPTRVLDTRRIADFALSGKKRLWPNWTRPFELPNNSGGFGPRSQMKGIAMNATVVKSVKRGFLTVLPARTIRNEVSNLNAVRAGQVVANHVITPASTSGVEMFAHCGGDVLADVAGWYVGPQKSTNYSGDTIDPPPPEAPFNWLLSVPRIGLQNWVMPHPDGDAIVDSGNSWHWTGTGIVGQANSSIVVFGHRTSHGGPYRNQHLLTFGDEFVLDIPDQRQYRYRYAGEQITNWLPSNILNAARANSSGTTITMVSCTGGGSQASPGVKNDQPLGGVHWRLVTTFVLTGWTDTRPHEG